MISEFVTLGQAISAAESEGFEKTEPIWWFFVMVFDVGRQVNHASGDDLKLISNALGRDLPRANIGMHNAWQNTEESRNENYRLISQNVEFDEDSGNIDISKLNLNILKEKVTNIGKLVDSNFGHFEIDKTLITVLSMYLFNLFNDSENDKTNQRIRRNSGIMTFNIFLAAYLIPGSRS